MYKFFCIAFHFLISGVGSKEEMSISSVQQIKLLLKRILNISSLDPPDNASVFCRGPRPRLKVDFGFPCCNSSYISVQNNFFGVIFKDFSSSTLQQLWVIFEVLAAREG